MHHASSRNLQAENDEESGSSGADDDDLLRHTRVNDEEASGPVVHTIPSEGYRIFNLRPPTPAPVSFPEHLIPKMLIRLSRSPYAILLLVMSLSRRPSSAIRMPGDSTTLSPA